MKGTPVSFSLELNYYRLRLVECTPTLSRLKIHQKQHRNSHSAPGRYSARLVLTEVFA